MASYNNSFANLIESNAAHGDAQQFVASDFDIPQDILHSLESIHGEPDSLNNDAGGFAGQQQHPQVQWQQSQYQQPGDMYNYHQPSQQAYNNYNLHQYQQPQNRSYASPFTHQPQPPTDGYQNVPQHHNLQNAHYGFENLHQAQHFQQPTTMYGACQSIQQYQQPVSTTVNYNFEGSIFNYHNNATIAGANLQPMLQPSPFAHPQINYQHEQNTAWTNEELDAIYDRQARELIHQRALEHWQNTSS